MIIALALVATLLVPVAPAMAASDHQAVIDISFPVAGESSFIRDFADCRSGCRRHHRATDIMAPYGAQVLAAVGGTIGVITGLDGAVPRYGYMISIDGDDGRRYAYVHLGRQDAGPSQAYASGLREGSRVERGQHIGFNGCSGNASCEGPHTHFEIYDSSVGDPYAGEDDRGARIDPYDSLVAARARGDIGGRVPVAGDWDGDGIATPGYFEGGTWMFYDSLTADEPYRELQYGEAGDVPVVGDWDGDGVETVGVVRGNVWILRSQYVRGANDVVLAYGQASDKKVVGDWDGDGKDTIGVVRGNLFILRSVYKRGAKDVVMSYGFDTDQPIVGDWDGNGTDTLGVIRGVTWILRNRYKSGADDVIFEMPVAGAHVRAARWERSGNETAAVVNGSTWTIRQGMHDSSRTSSYEVR
jgi:hypothetical protein